MNNSKWPLRISVYGAGEAVNNTGQLDTYIQTQLNNLRRVATNRYVAAVAQLDASSFSSKRYILDPLLRPEYDPINIQNFNTGDPQNLVEFVRWSSQICPAERSILVLSGHGAAWQDEFARKILGTRGVPLPARITSKSFGNMHHHPRRLFGPAISPTNTVTKMVLLDGGNKDYLSNAELGTALDQCAYILRKPIDVLVFDACLMCSWEILQEISVNSSVATVVSSVDELSAAGIDLSRPAVVATQRQGAMTAQELAGTIAQQFSPAASFDSCIAIDLSISNWKTAIEYFKVFCDEFLQWIQDSSGNAKAARDALRLSTTSIVKFWNQGLADVAKLAEAVNAISGLPENCIQAIKSVESNLNSCVLGKSLGNDYATALGISIFTPTNQDDYMKNKPDYTRLRFWDATSWGKVLDALYADR